MALVSIPVDITPPPADDSLEEPRERRVRHEPVPASDVASVADFAEALLDIELLPFQRRAFERLSPERIAA
ncbi:hypothetical protein SEA_BARNSTORMER_65 [Microbacterium phage Barnstormer]|uniref:Uncharacterized protein n=1 Tax=Microbacterium phage Barnstormer TaxID=3028491 RepID=A0AAE9ZNU8_9CAUD|nr:hypothetical protein SEA_BARNSTORMER_65 [Microbacterium phage Barnstormer]WDS52171.1 hypothetical protein SEA_UTZCHIPS_65 [Microbacterium phage UtzChips]